MVGRGFGLGIAQEAALKFKETCGLHAEAFSAAEVRHGPMALVGPDFPVLCFVQDDDTRPSTLAVAREFRARGAQVFAGGAGRARREQLAAARARHAGAVHAAADRPALLSRGQRRWRCARGFDPDVPPHLNKVTETV